MKNNRKQSAKLRTSETLNNGLTYITTRYEDGSTKQIICNEKKLPSADTEVTVIETGNDGLSNKICYTGLFFDNAIRYGQIAVNGIITHEVIEGKLVPISKTISEVDKVILDEGAKTIEEGIDEKEGINKRFIVQKVQQSIEKKQPSNRVQSASVYKASNQNFTISK